MNPFIWLTKASGMIRALMAKPGGAKAVTEALKRIKMASVSGMTSAWQKVTTMGGAAMHGLALDQLKKFFAAVIVTVLTSEALSFALQYCDWDDEFIAWVRAFSNDPAAAAKALDLPDPNAYTQNLPAAAAMPLIGGGAGSLPDLTGRFTSIVPTNSLPVLGASNSVCSAQGVKERMDRVELLAGVFGSVSVIPRVIDALSKVTAEDVHLHNQLYR